MLAAQDGRLYGYSGNVLFQSQSNGTGFQTLHTFSGTTFAQGPIEIAGKIYGAIPFASPTTRGALFRVDPNGSGYEELVSFPNEPLSGQAPLGFLIPSPDGALYGLTQVGGYANRGTIFRAAVSVQVAITGTISYCSNPAPGPVPNVLMTLTGNSSGTTLSDATGNYLFSVTSGSNYTVTPSKPRLVGGAGGINTVDVVAVQRHFLNIGAPLSGCRLLAADVNNDAMVNTVDITAIQRFVLALPAGTANVGIYRFTPANRTYQVININQTSQNYDTLVLGDVVMPFVE